MGDFEEVNVSQLFVLWTSVLNRCHWGLSGNFGELRRSARHSFFPSSVSHASPRALCRLVVVPHWDWKHPIDIYVTRYGG